MAQNPVVFVALLLPLTRVKTHLKGRTNFNLKACCKTLLIRSNFTTLRCVFCTLANLESCVIGLKSSNVRMLVNINNKTWVLLWVLPKLLRPWMATTLPTYWFCMGLWLCKRKIFQINGSVKNSSKEYTYSKFISNYATVVLCSFIYQRNKIFQSQTISKCRIDGKLNVWC